MLFGPKMSRFIKICSYDQFPLISGPLNRHFVKETCVRPLFGYFKIGNCLFIEPGTEKKGFFFYNKYFVQLLKSKMIKIPQYETQQPQFHFLNRSFCRKASVKLPRSIYFF